MSDIADQKEINRLNAEVEALRGEVARLDRMLDEYRNALNRASRWKSRAEIAEAQAAALRAAAGGGEDPLPHFNDAQKALFVSALLGKHQPGDAGPITPPKAGEEGK